MGAPGSGKTSVGRALAELGYWFEDREAELLARYRSIDEFVRQKDTAVAELHAAFLVGAAAHPGRWVYESTALTERDFVLSLRAEHDAFLVHLDVPFEATLARVAARAPGANLTSDLVPTERAWRFCDEAHRTLPFDLVVPTDGESPAEIAALIARTFESRDTPRV